MNDRQAPQPLRYRGRFAPTPSGPLHLGSLLTALASYLDARHHRGRWLLRIDDLDTPRCVPGADTTILRQLEAHGLRWDEQPRYQSAHRDAYQSRLSELQQNGQLYACRCTRAELALIQIEGPDAAVYPGLCRSLALAPQDHALRFIVGDGALAYDDAIRGPLVRDRARELGDFVVQRRDGIIGYHLACAIDEHAQAITMVMRGGDLIGASFAQLAVMEALRIPAPQYAHLPVLIDHDGRKLSKQNHAAPLDASTASDNLWHCLHWLEQSPPADLHRAGVNELMSWAQQHWRREQIPPLTSLAVEAAG